MNTIEVRNLKKYYNRGKVKAVDDISFEVPEGSRFGFLGPNGAGKTTTIRCLLGFLNLDSGSISLFGKKVNPKKEVKFRNRVGYLPGELGVYRNLTAHKLIKYFAHLYAIDIDWKYINEIAERLNLAMDRKIGTLSKGNKQKVGVLNALMGKFELYIMDEPTSGLDPLMQAEFYRIISERQKESNCTVFVSSHVLPEVEKFCDQVAIIRNGKIAEISTVHELKTKSLKHIELEFETKESKKEFLDYLSVYYPQASIQYQFNTELTFLLSLDDARRVLKEISEKSWSGKLVKDFTIQHSTLEKIFMQYYKNGGENA